MDPEEPDEPGNAIPCAPAVGVFGGWAAPVGAQTPLVLMDGSVFVHQARSLNWWKLYPDSNGDYANGTWVQAASMIAKPDYDYNPLYYCSAVLPDGRVVVIGGEYNYEVNATTGVPAYVVRQLNRGEIYNPYTDTWAKLPGPTGWGSIGDMMCTVMPGTKRLMLARQSSTQLAVLNPDTLAWSAFTPTGKTSGDSNSEEGWTLLPDSTVVVINANTGMASQRFIPNLAAPNFAGGQWVNAGTIPVPLRDSGSHETGAQVLMYNGKVFAVGADRNTGSNAVFTPPPKTTPPSTALGSWAAAPPFPRKGPYAATLPSTNCTGTVPNLMCQLDQADGPGVLMPNGRVLVNAGPGVFNKDTYWFEYEPNDNSLTEVERPPNSINKVQYQYHMVLLPSGQVFAPDGTATIPIYTPSGGPDPAWAPTVTSVPGSLKPGQTYNLSGMQLNGLTEANSYGDDYASATNFPIIKITNRATGHVFWARTHDRDNMNVATGTDILTTKFDVPANLELGLSDLVVIANGIPSASVEVNHPPVTTAALSGIAGNSGWWRSNVQVTLSATDPEGAADIVATHFSIDGGADQIYTVPFTVSGDANHVVAFWTEDTAGNRDTPARTAAINIDATNPTLTFAAAVPAANGFGWNNTSVDISFATADNFSGVASAVPSTPLHFGSEGAGQTRSVVVTDEAGNSATFTTVAINIDFTAPAISISPSLPSLWPPNNKLVPDAISGRITDGGSGIDGATASYTVIDEYATIQPSGPVTIGADGRYSFTLMMEASRRGDDADGRTYRVVITVRDRAGNSFSTSTIVAVPHDQGNGQ